MSNILTINNKTREMTTPTVHPFLLVCATGYGYSGSISVMVQGNKILIISGLWTTSTRLSHLPHKDFVNLLSRSENGWDLPLQVSWTSQLHHLHYSGPLVSVMSNENVFVWYSEFVTECCIRETLHHLSIILDSNERDFCFSLGMCDY